MPRYRKLTTICAAVVLSLGLAACGGGSSSNKTEAPSCPEGQVGTPPNCADKTPTPVDNAMAGLEAAGGAAQMAGTALAAANGALGTATGAVTAAAQAFDDATGDAIASAKAAYDAAVADLTTKKGAQAAAAASLGEAIAAYEMARSVLSILDPGNAALASAATAIATLEAAQADMSAVDAADAALAVAANTADPVTTKAAFDAADTAHSEAMATQTTEKGDLDKATTALDNARMALEGASGDGVAAAVAAYNTAVADLTAAQAAYDAAVADTKAKLAVLDKALEAWAKADPDAVGLKNAMAEVAKLKADQEEAAKQAAAELKKVQDQLDKAKADLQKILDDIEAAKKAEEDKKMAAKNAGYTAALDREIVTSASFESGTSDWANIQSHRRLMAIGIDQRVSGATTNLTIKRRSPLKLTVSGWTQSTEAAPSIGSGWNGAILTQNRKNTDGTPVAGLNADSTAYVYSDIDKATSQSTKITTFTAPGAGSGVEIDDHIPVAMTIANTDTGVFSINSGTAGTRWWMKNSGVVFASGILPANEGTTKLLPDNFSATINGIPGTIRCPEPDQCTANKTGANVYTIGLPAGTTLTFSPTAGKDATVTTYTDDSEYLTFGWWIDTPDNGKATDYRFGSFADPTGTYTEIPDAVIGTAKYKGPAAGVYAEKKHGTQEARSGMFTAEASLTANFFDATNGGGLVSGSVTKFMSGGESLGNWSVVLGGPAQIDAGNANTTTTTLTDGKLDGDSGTGVAIPGSGVNIDGGVTSGSFDGLAVTGVWQGQFAGDPTDAKITGSENDAPENIVGTFDASTHGTSPAGAIQVSGAFGAKKQ